jgi:hypothetical protein
MFTNSSHFSFLVCQARKFSRIVTVEESQIWMTASLYFTDECFPGVEKPPEERIEVSSVGFETDETTPNTELASGSNEAAQWKDEQGNPRQGP